MNDVAPSGYTYQAGFVRRARWLLAALWLLAAIPCLSQAAAVATLERDAIYSGETVTLRITTSGDDAGKQPDLAPLRKSFEVLGTSSSAQIQVINGQRSDRHEWLIELAPVAKGAVTIPALTVGGSSTRALTLQVSDQPASATAQAGAPVFLSAEIDAAQRDSYVQQQILYTVRLYYRIPLIEGSFTDPKTENAVVERLGEDRQYNTTIDGRSYQVVERRYAIFPEHSGSLTITPTLFQGRTVSATDRRSTFGRMDSLIERMLNRNGFNDPFFSGTPFGDPGKKIRLQSNAVTLDVRPRPESYQGAHWLPTQKLELQDSWRDSPPIIRAGEPVTRTLTLEAQGLEASQLPNIPLTGSDTLRIYPEPAELSNRTDGDWIHGRSEQRYTYVASQPGKLTLPAIQVSWWDSVNHRQQKSVLPAWEVLVEAGVGAAAQPTAAPPSAPAPVPAATQTSPPKMAATAGPPPSVEREAEPRLYWLLGGGAGVAALAAALLLYRRRRRRQAPSPAAVTRPGLADTPQPARLNDGQAAAQSRQSLRDACTGSDPQSASGALLAWAAATWPQQPPRSLGALAARVDQGGEHIRALEAALYGAEKQHWDGQPLWESFENGLLHAGKRAVSPPREAGAPPLYPEWRKQA